MYVLVLTSMKGHELTIQNQQSLDHPRRAIKGIQYYTDVLSYIHALVITCMHGCVGLCNCTYVSTYMWPPCLT